MKSLRTLFPFKSYLQFPFLLPVSWPTFEFPMSADVGGVIFGSDMVENMGISAEIASLSCPSQKLFLVPVWCFNASIGNQQWTKPFSAEWPPFLNFGSRPTSGNVGIAITESGVIDIMGFAVSV